MINKKLLQLPILILCVLFLLINNNLIAYSQDKSGLAELIDPVFSGKKFSSSLSYNPDENSCITSDYPILSVLLLENIINGRKTIVYVIDNTYQYKYKDSIIAISNRALSELGNSGEKQVPVKISLLKMGSGKVETPSTTQNIDSTGTQNSTTTQTGQSTPASAGENQTSINTGSESNLSSTSSIQIITGGQNTAKNYYYIQVGAFKDKNNALQLASKLKSLGYKVFIYYNNLYKVLIGPYNTYEEALEIKKLLSSIIQKDQPFIFSSSVLLNP